MWRRRLLVGLALAVVLHAASWWILRALAGAEAAPVPASRIAVALVHPHDEGVAPAERLDERPPRPPVRVPSRAPTAPTSASTKPPATPVPAAAPPAGEPRPDEGSPPGDVAPVGPRSDGEARMRGVVRGASEGPQPSLGTLAGATVPGPQSDAARAAMLAKQRLVADLSAHDVARGLADDWFRRRRTEVERVWHPQDAELNDGGKEVRADQLMLRTAANPLLWGALNKKIAGEGSALAQSFSDDRGSAIEQMMQNPLAPGESDAARKQRLFDALETHRDALAESVGLEVTLRHRADGSVEAVDVTTPSGQPRIDDGAVDAIARAFALDDKDAAPARVARGMPFTSTWTLAVRWEVLVPKCSVMRTGTSATSELLRGETVPVGCGTTFGNDGVDVPFTVKKSTHVELVAVEPL